MNFIEELKTRKVRKYLAIYISASITTIGLTHLFSLRYNLPTYIFDTFLVFLLMGIPVIIVIAWKHGKEGKQKIAVWEYLFHLFLFLSAIALSFYLANRGPIKILSLNAKTIAVLPFKNLSDSKEDEYFSDGITEDILTQLSKISKLKVISRTSVMKYKNSNLSLPEIGKKLGAGSILEGSVRRSDKKVRITGQLINATNDEHIWAETFDRKLDDIFEVQSEIAKHIAKELEAKLAPKETILIETKPTNNIDAYAYYLMGRKLASKYSDIDNEKAIEFYKKALSIDSSYALAYAGLASSYDQKVRRYFYPEIWRDSAIISSRKALSLNPNLAEGHSSLAKSYEAKFDFKLAKYHYEEAIRLNPNYYAAIYNLGIVYFNEEKLDVAHNLIRKSIQLEPDNVFGYIVSGALYQKFGCDNSALFWFMKALELESNNLLAHLYIVEQFILMKNYPAADKYINNLFDIAPNWPYGLALKSKLELLKENYTSALHLLEKSNEITGQERDHEYAFLLLKLSKKDSAERILSAKIDEYMINKISKPSQSFTSEFTLANALSIFGNKKLALSNLEEAVKKGFIEYRKILVYPYMDSLKHENKFLDLVSIMRAKSDSMMLIASADDINLIECK